MVYGASPSSSEISINDSHYLLSQNHAKIKGYEQSRNIVIISHLPFLAFLQEGFLDIAGSRCCFEDLKHRLLLFLALRALVDRYCYGERAAQRGDD